MDLNVKLIEAVKKCPLLYKTNASLAERQSGWKLISEQMKMQERFLQSRWHFLLKRYQQEYQSEGRDIGQDFIYKKEMEFLLPHIRHCSTTKEQAEALASEEILPDNVIKPEFIITEEDFDNDSGNEEFVYLEVETLEGSGTEDEQKGKQQVKEQQSEQEQQTSNKPNSVVVKKENLSLDTQSSESGKLEKQNKQKSPEKVIEKPENMINIKTECTQFDASHEIASNHIEENSNINSAPLQAQPQSKEIESNNANTNERCEDDIFGELVTAMLKRMPVEKKRGVKKEIMNILLT